MIINKHTYNLHEQYQNIIELNDIFRVTVVNAPITHYKYMNSVITFNKR